MSRHAGIVPKNHPRQIMRRGVDDATDDRATRPCDFDPLHDRFGFTLDVAAAPHNAKCERYFTREQDGLAQSWAGETVWCNPPYSDLASWIRKAWAEHTRCPAIVLLLPADRTEQPFWQRLVEPYRDRPRSSLRTEFIAGRREFLRPGQTAVRRGDRSPFGLVLLIWQTLAWTPDTIPSGGLMDGLSQGALV